MVTNAQRARRGRIPRVVLIGATGTGKTAWVRHRIRTAADSEWLVDDPEGEYEPQDFPRRPCFVLSTVDDLEGIERPKSGNGIYLFRHADGESVAQLALDMCNVAVVFDEGDQDFAVDTGKPNKRTARWRVFNRGRQHEVSVYLLCRSVFDIARTTTRNASHVVFGVITEPSDLKEIEKRCGPETAALVAALPDPEISAPKEGGVRLVEVKMRGIKVPQAVFVPFNPHAKEKAA